jgi:DNA modification methylase
MDEDELRALLVAIENASAIIPWPKNAKNVWHPTEKPVGLLERLINDGTEVPGAVVYDPFVGSGSTVIACERLGRRCRGIDRSPGWVASAIERWHLVTGKEPVCER